MLFKGILLKESICKIYVGLKRAMGTVPNWFEAKVPIDDVHINYVQIGSGAHSVLLMPGALGSARTDFKPQMEMLPKLLPDYTIFAWDPPGYGKSRPPNKKFNLDFFHRDGAYAKKLMETLGKPRFSILGWSDGGQTGIILAAKYPEAVEKLLIWGSQAYVNDDEMKFYQSMRDVKVWSEKSRSAMEEVYGIEGFASLWSDWVDIYERIYKNKAGDICKGLLNQIKIPVMIMHGKKDPIVASEHVPYLLKHLVNSEYYEFKDGKHNIHLRYADEFNKIASEFLSK